MQTNEYCEIIVDRTSGTQGSGGGNQLMLCGQYKGTGIFAPSYDMAVVWNRLSSGNPEERDILLLHHELLETTVEKEYNLTAADAHAIAKAQYN